MCLSVIGFRVHPGVLKILREEQSATKPAEKRSAKEENQDTVGVCRWKLETKWEKCVKQDGGDECVKNHLNQVTIGLIIDYWI